MQETRVWSQVRKIPWWREWLPTQNSCLENSSDRRAWWATVHGIAKSWTRLSTSAHQPIIPHRNLPRSLLIWEKPSPAPSLQRTCPGINPPPLQAQIYSSYYSQWKSQCPVLTWLRTPMQTPLLSAPAPRPGQDAKRQEKDTSAPTVACGVSFPVSCTSGGSYPAHAPWLWRPFLCSFQPTSG